MFMVRSLIIVGLLCSICSCKGDEDPVPTPVPEPAPSISAIDFVMNGSIFKTTISGQQITTDRPIPFGVESIQVNAIQLGKNSVSEISAGTMLNTNEGPITIKVTNSVSLQEISYTLTFKVREFATPVEQYGLLQTEGNKIIDKNGDPVSLAGNSFFWSNNNWGGSKYYQSSVVSWLDLDWGTTIVRAAMGVDDDGGYLDDKTSNKNRVKTIVDAAIDNGLYVIIDWHSHHAEDYESDAIEFFQEMATTYGSYDNVIYEIYNEPLNISWTEKLKPYAERVVAAIREIDEDNLIVVGTPEWSQRVDLAAADPITSSNNIAYTLHFYTVYHQQWLRDRAAKALVDGIPLFITEWGSIGYTQSDPETDLWMKWCKDNKISHCNWAVNDKAEEWSILKAGANTTGAWSDSQLSEAGKLSRKIIRTWEN